VWVAHRGSSSRGQRPPAVSGRYQQALDLAMGGGTDTHAVAPRRFEILRTIDHPERIPEIIKVVTDAYVDSPMFSQPFTPAHVREGLDIFNAWRIKNAGSSSEFWLDADGHVEGHVMLMNKTEAPPPKPEELAELLAIPQRFGDDVMERWKFAVGVFSQQATEAASRLDKVECLWNLQMLAVREDRRGCGVGTGVLRQLIADRIEALAGAGKTIRVTLMSQMEQNLTLYKRLGFDVVFEGKIAGGSEFSDINIPNWVMSKLFCGAPACVQNSEEFLHQSSM